jgi:hypothetical protein
MTSFSISHNSVLSTISSGRNSYDKPPDSQHAERKYDPLIPTDSPTDILLAKFFSAGLLDANYQLTLEAIQGRLPFLTEEKRQDIDRLLSKPLTFTIPIPKQQSFYTISFSMKEFLLELKNACVEKKIKIENILIIGGAVPWILGSDYYVALLENLVPGSTSGLSENERMAIDLPPSDVDIRFIIPSGSREHIPWLKNRLVAYLCDKIPSVDHSQREREDMITSRNVFQEFQHTTLWDQEKRQIDIDYFIFGINDRLQSKFEVSLAGLLKRPFLFSSQNLCLDIAEFISEKKRAVMICPMGLGLPWHTRDAAQAILEKVARIFHIPNPETVDKKGWICYCSFLTKLFYCPEEFSLQILRKTTLEHCIHASKESKKASTPLHFLINFLEWSIKKHHASQPDDAIALAFNLCSTAESQLNQSDLSDVWQSLVAKFPTPSKSLIPLHIFSRAMHNPVLSFDILSAIVELQSFFHICSPHPAKSSSFTAYLKRGQRSALQFVDKNLGVLLTFDPLKAFELVNRRLTELLNEEEFPSIDELEQIWKAFSIPIDPSKLRVVPFIHAKGFLGVTYSALEMEAMKLMEHEAPFARKIGYRLFLLLQELDPELRRRDLLIRHLPAMLILEESRMSRMELLQDISKAFLTPHLSEASLLLQKGLDAIGCQSKIDEEEILIQWTLSLARIHAHPFYADVRFFWNDYQTRIKKREGADELSKPLIQILLPSNLSMAGYILLRTPAVHIEERVDLFFSIASARNLHRKLSEHVIELDVLVQLTIDFFPKIPEHLFDKNSLAMIVKDLMKLLLEQKQIKCAKALLSTEAKRQVLTVQDARNFWALLCHSFLNDPAQKITSVLSLWNEAALYGFWHAKKPSKLILQMIEKIYAQKDPGLWRYADSFVDELCSDPEITEENKCHAIRLFTAKNKIGSLKTSSIYKQMKSLFDPFERLDFLRQLLDDQIAKKNIEECIDILKELMQISSFPENIHQEFISVYHLLDNLLTDISLGNPACGHDFLQMLCHPLVVKTLSKDSLFPLNFAIRLCHFLMLQDVECKAPVLSTLLDLSRKPNKIPLLETNAILLGEVIGQIVQSNDLASIHLLADQSEHILVLLRNGKQPGIICSFLMKCNDKQIKLDTGNHFLENLVWAMQQVVDSVLDKKNEYTADPGNQAACAIHMVSTLLITFSGDQPLFQASFNALKVKVMEALLHLCLFIEAGAWVEWLGKGACLSSLSLAVLLEWIPKLAAGRQYDASAELLKMAFRSSNHSADAYACLWSVLPAEMFHLYPQIGSKLCLHASKAMTEELKPVVEKMLFACVESKTNLLPMETAVLLLERYPVPHPQIWRFVFAKVEAQTQASKAKQRLLPLLTKTAEPSRILYADPATRRSCWLSALRCCSLPPSEPLGGAWKEILEDGDAFLQIFPENDPVLLGEAFILFLEVWLSSLEKPNKDPDLFDSINSTLDKLNHALTHSSVDLYKQKTHMQKILLQMIRGGIESSVSSVLLQTCDLFETLLREVRCFMSTEFFKNRDAEIAKAFKKLMSSARNLVEQTADEQPFIVPRLFNLMQGISELFDDEWAAGIFEHLLSLDSLLRLEIMFECHGYEFLRVIMDYVLRKFNAWTNTTDVHSHIPKKDSRSYAQFSRLIGTFLEKASTIHKSYLGSSKAFPINLFFQYASFCDHPAFLYFTNFTQQQAAFSKLVEMLYWQRVKLKEEDEEFLINYILNEFPFSKSDPKVRTLFVRCAIDIFLKIVHISKDSGVFCQCFQEFFQNYGSYIPSSSFKINEQDRNANKQASEFKWNVLSEILARCNELMQYVNPTASPPQLHNSTTRLCYEEITRFLGDKVIQILASIELTTAFKNNPESSRNLLNVINRVISTSLLLHDVCHTSYFKALQGFFHQLEINGCYSHSPGDHLVHTLILKYSREGVGLFLTPAMVIKAIQKVMEWSAASNQPLCVYRMLRILELNQDSFYLSNSQEFIAVYQNAQDQVMKTPFYKVAPFHQEEPDRLLGLQNRRVDPEINLYHALIESFLLIDIRHFYLTVESRQAPYNAIWKNLFKMVLEMLRATLKSSSLDKEYSQLVQALNKLTQHISLAKDLVAHSQKKTDSSFYVLNKIYEKIPYLDRKSFKNDYFESLTHIASMVEVFNLPPFVKEERVEGFMALSEKAKLFRVMVEKSPLHSILSYNELMDYISLGVVPTYLSMLLNTLSSNTLCEEEEKFEVYTLIYKDIIDPILKNKTAWDSIANKIFTWYLQELSSSGLHFAKYPALMLKYIEHLKMILQTFRDNKFFSFLNHVHVNCMKNILDAVVASLQRGSEHLEELVSIIDVICMPTNDILNLEEEKVKIELINTWIVKILEVVSVDLLKSAWNVIDSYKEDVCNHNDIFHQMQDRLQKLELEQAQCCIRQKPS